MRNDKWKRRNIRVLLALVPAFVAPLQPVTASAQQIDIPGPVGSHGFGYFVAVLPNGNIVVTDPQFSTDGNDAVGAVYLYTPSGSLVSTLTGSTANDLVGVNGITVLTNGNFVVSSPYWNSPTAVAVGAATWVDGTKGLSGVVSAANSLVGTLDNDAVSAWGVYPLRNGNYVVESIYWHLTEDTPGTGASTWADGDTGISGPVSAANSLFGSAPGDVVGMSVVELANGNYVVVSTYWANGSEQEAGAVTWVNGATGLTGPVLPSNSVVGTHANDRIGLSGVVALNNGNYVVESPWWSNFSGAVTWFDGSARTTGTISAANSLTGAFGSNQFSMHVTPLTNGNYVVCDAEWNGGMGAATWADGKAGLVGVVSAANSLVGARSGDYVGLFCATPLTNGNYVIASQDWSIDAVTTNVGAVTWGNGKTGTVGLVSSANSLIGMTKRDYVGSDGAIALSNGNYVVGSPYWSTPTALNVGAVTWANGSTGLSGHVTAENSLVGTTPGDSIGGGGPSNYSYGRVTALTNGNYVVSSPVWHNGSITNAGAVTWANGSVGMTGTVSTDNSIVGTRSGDFVGNSVTALTNGNYVIPSPYWSNGTATNVGAATWMDGSIPTRGGVSAANSLIGSMPSDFVGGADLSLAFAQTQPGVAALSNGNYVVTSPLWQDTTIGQPVGAMTLGHGTGGTIGPVSASNSVRGHVANAGQSMVYAYDAARDQLIVGQPASNGVSIFKGSGSASGYVNPNQHGITGSWYNPATPGQGIEIEVYPDLAGFGRGVLFAGWFTFDVTAPGGQRWYALQGIASSNNTTLDLDIATGYGGNFNATPAVAGSVVGHATLQFTDCNFGVLTYNFTDGSGRTGTIPLLRLITNVTCSPTGNNGSLATDYLLSGSWYDSATGGQGLIFDINPIQHYLFAAWYTFAINGQQTGGPASQRWYTLQSGDFADGTTSLSGIGIYTAKGGIFDDPKATMTEQVGAANIVFVSCNALTLSYAFTNPENFGRAGTIHLTRTGPAPAGCSL